MGKQKKDIGEFGYMRRIYNGLAEEIATLQKRLKELDKKERFLRAEALKHQVQLTADSEIKWFVCFEFTVANRFFFTIHLLFIQDEKRNIMTMSMCTFFFLFSFLCLKNIYNIFYSLFFSFLTVF